MNKENKSLRVIIDSNVWISFLIGKNLKGLQFLIDSKKIKIITSTEQFYELSEVLARPKFKKYFSKEQASEFFELLEESSEHITIKTKVNICRDPKDNYLLALSHDSKANFIITGDKDLLDLEKYGKTKIIRYTEFESEI